MHLLLLFSKCTLLKLDSKSVRLEGLPYVKLDSGSKSRQTESRKKNLDKNYS